MCENYVILIKTILGGAAMRFEAVSYTHLVLSISRQGVVYAMTIVVLSKIFGYTGVLAAQACADVLTAVMAGLIIRHIFFRHKDHNV